MIEDGVEHSRNPNICASCSCLADGMEELLKGSSDLFVTAAEPEFPQVNDAELIPKSVRKSLR